jgi:phospholipid/cholesterol/gamma-HCH transport system ATP-binding protein
MSDTQKNNQPQIRLKDVKKSFGAKRVLAGIDLDIAKGESVVVIGGSGTGKSVLIKCIIGILLADSGLIEVDGQDVAQVPAGARDEINKKFGMLFQGAALFDSLPVWENIAFGLMQRERMSRRQGKERAIETMAKVGLAADVAELSPAELSGGMQKRVGLARAIAGNPEIIFFDEPTTGLDPIMADVINDLIVSIVKNQGMTALSITHDMHSARKIADRITMLYEGKLIWAGDAKDVDNSGNPYVEQFVHGKAEGPIKMQVRK